MNAGWIGLKTTFHVLEAIGCLQDGGFRHIYRLDCPLPRLENLIDDFDLKRADDKAQVSANSPYTSEMRIQSGRWVQNLPSKVKETR